MDSINPRDLAVCDPNFVLEYFRLSADKRLLFGGRINYFGDDPSVIKKNLTPRMLQGLPGARRTRRSTTPGAARSACPSTACHNLAGSRRTILYAQGYSGHGVNVTHLAGQILADAVAGTCERFDLFANIKPVRVPGASLLQKPMVALGVAYYQLRDLL